MSLLGRHSDRQSPETDRGKWEYSGVFVMSRAEEEKEEVTERGGHTLVN